MSLPVARYVYGPVPSRRLGRSLGVDLVPFKTCSYDCVYCQLGRTTNPTVERKEYVPVDAVLAELAGRLPRAPAPDFIGLAGSGEPTLHARIGDVIAGIKRMTDIPVAVLTNGSMLWVPEVRAGLERADLVLPSLDAGDARGFERVNRPHRDISFHRMIEGLIVFAEGFRGAIWLEVFVLAGITDTPEEIGRIAAIVERIHPARVQLNTVARPPAEEDARVVPADRLDELRRSFSVPCDVIAESRRIVPADPVGGGGVAERIVDLLARRPCTVEGLAVGLGLPPNEVVKHLEVLSAGGAVRPVRREDTVFYERVRTP
jgi:wyosine [tRNA(Phe)-imidazoG37] synthetase (radical SAM superfamily)